MKISKNELAGALKVLGKCGDLVHIVGRDRSAWVMATNGVEIVTIEFEIEVSEPLQSVVSLSSLRQAIGGGKVGEVELKTEDDEVGVYELGRSGVRRIGIRKDIAPWPELGAAPAGSTPVALSEITAALTAVAQVVDRSAERLILRGVNLNSSGVVATDGKLLLQIPLPNALSHDLTLPFPFALLVAMPEGDGELMAWRVGDDLRFRLEIGNFVWLGKALNGEFPNWRQIVPDNGCFDYSIMLAEDDVPTVLEWLKRVPDSPPYHAVELNVIGDAEVEFIPHANADFTLKVPAKIEGDRPAMVLALNKFILSRMLTQGYTKFHANSQNFMPILATGGLGNFIAMPVRINAKLNQTTENVNKEIDKMEESKKIEIEPLEELNTGLEALRQNLKQLFETSATLSRKIKEATLAQKQREREYIQAKRAIERIRLAI